MSYHVMSGHGTSRLLPAWCWWLLRTCPLSVCPSSMCPCHPSHGGSLVPGAPCGAVLGITLWSEFFGWVRPCCWAFSGQIWCQGLIFRGLTQGDGGGFSSPLSPSGRTSAVSSPSLLSFLLTILCLFPRRKKGTPRGRRKKAPPFKTKKPPSLPRPRTRRWRCRGRAAMRRRWPRRRKVRLGGLRRGGRPALSQLCCTVVAEALCTTAPGLQTSALMGGSRLSPQSHTEVTASRHTRRLWPFRWLQLSRLRGAPWIAALLPCLSGGRLFWEGRAMRELRLPLASAVATGHLWALEELIVGSRRDNPLTFVCARPVMASLPLLSQLVEAALLAKVGEATARHAEADVPWWVFSSSFPFQGSIFLLPSHTKERKQLESDNFQLFIA